MCGETSPQFDGFAIGLQAALEGSSRFDRTCLTGQQPQAADEIPSNPVGGEASVMDVRQGQELG